ncbi:Rhamnolipids biosynthesis 3-oxoacyl-[acyl-carrier-protein] reductase [Hypsizygus marmoreus]|uniref:Rhamnolipids biosynthesis 3-oxoacyl-[acyl-carrier-protein] reductase n=1 Tax=Hypsizygus marmoreus TaxID=39966 RepID=A0A369J9E8_HYPMA|nr:Rhamnolipids biosynthesis 3-oxoacyl-[acyl-carrier-protein] reductase [Hypsizygus marmoreus]
MSYRLQTLYDLSGRVAIVTGGGTGIGLHIAQGLAASGAKVYITGRRLAVLQKVADLWTQSNEGGLIIPLQMDVTSKESITEAKKIIQEREGKLHILVNNAGQSGPTSPFLGNPSAPELKNAETLGQALFDNEAPQQWADLYAINTFSVFFVTTAFLGLLDKGSQDVDGFSSSVINITSISGIIKLAQEHFAYNSAKAAASHLTKMLATEFALKGVNVRVNAIAPGVYASEMTHDSIGPEKVDKVGKGVLPVPAKRAGTGEEMAGTAVYLASRAGGYVNGQEIIIDGGYVAVNPATT